MNETRKAIIELIEPFMDKTLSEGCIIKTDKGFIGEIKRISQLGFYEIGFDGRIESVNNLEFKKQTKIIGHYDITAVLKYIGSIGKITLSCLTFDVKNTQDILLGEIKINKPLNLYTEQEEKDLLELLLKLK